MKKTKEIVSVSFNQYERKQYNPFKLKDLKNERLLKKSLLLGKKKININIFIFYFISFLNVIIKFYNDSFFHVLYSN